jgi:hypothetical protein
MNFYLYAFALGAGISLVWVAWLLAARAVLRVYKLRPGYVLSILQVAIVLALMLAGYRLSDYCMRVLGSSLPADTIVFRRIWIAIWAVAMLASIQIFLDIRRMAATGTNMALQPLRPPGFRVKRPPQRPVR